MTISLHYEVAHDGFSLAVNESIPDRGVTGVFGPSGSGKTTLLRCIAGLEGGGDPPHLRGVGYVFQEGMLFPHLDVRANIDYGARRAARMTLDSAKVTALMDLDGMLSRNVTTLSAGERQRVAIARALCCSPKLLLMDEPLSALDSRRRDALLPYLERVSSEFDIPMVYVSHDIDEVCRLCDHLLVLDKGNVVANDALGAVLARTDLPQFGGEQTGVVVNATPVRFDGEYGLTTLRISGGDIVVPGQIDRAVRLRIRANNVSLALARPAATSILNLLPATVIAIDNENPATALVQLRIGVDTLLARVTRRSADALGITPGLDVIAQVKSVTVRR